MDLFGHEDGPDVSGWIKLATDFYSHPKALAAGPTARHLYYVSLMWAGQYATDGSIPAYALPLLANFAGISPDEVGEVADRLVEVRGPGSDAGLWERTPDGWLIHDWLEWQTQAEDRKAEQATAKRLRDAANRRAAAAESRQSTANWSNRGASDQGVWSLVEVEVEVDAEVEKENTAFAVISSIEDDFDAWYSAYPRHRERPVALRAYVMARRGGARADELLAAANGYAATCRARGATADVIKYPATFLAKSRWRDFLPGGEGLTESEPESMIERLAAARARDRAELEALRAQ